MLCRDGRGCGGEGELTLSKVSETLIIADHTGVPDSMRGFGVAGALVEQLIACAAGQRIVPLCPLMRAQAMRNRADWSDVIPLLRRDWVRHFVEWATEEPIRRDAHTRKPPCLKLYFAVDMKSETLRDTSIGQHPEENSVALLDSVLNSVQIVGGVRNVQLNFMLDTAPVDLINSRTINMLPDG